MIKTLSLLIVFSIFLFAVTPFLIPFINPTATPITILFALGLGGISSVLLIVFLIKERFQQKEEEKDDLNKY